MSGYDPVFGRGAVQPNALGDAQRPVPAGAVPMRGLYGAADNRRSDAVPANWISRKHGTDPGVCVRCAASGKKGRKVAGFDLCSPHRIQDRRIAAKAAAEVEA